MRRWIKFADASIQEHYFEGAAELQERNNTKWMPLLESLLFAHFNCRPSLEGTPDHSQESKKERYICLAVAMPTGIHSF